MKKELLNKPNQAQRILKVLKDANGGWISGSYFLHTMLLSQYHARIWSLQKEGHNIEASDFTDNHNFKYYRLTEKGQTSLFNEQTKDQQDKLMCGY
jgi:hypothetical protein